MNPQYEAHERLCKYIGDMAKDNEALKQRIKVLENETNYFRQQISEMTTFSIRMENFINRFFDPEDLGYVVTPSVRDDARETLGRERVES